MAHRLAFRENNSFVIVQFTDVHWRDGDELDQKSRLLMDDILDAEQPDLVVFTGDTIMGLNTDDPIRAFNEAVAVAEDRGIAWALVFGNHDDEGGKSPVSNAELMALQENSKYGIGSAGPEDVHGIGNFVVELTDNTGSFAKVVLYFLDSGAYAPKTIEWDWIRQSQVEWYTKLSKGYKANNGGSPVPSLAFFHIPLLEYEEAWQQNICYGVKYEEIGCSRINSGLFAAMLENGDMMGTFVGHDHINDFWSEHHGIQLCYGRASGYNTYGREGFPRGARVIRLHLGEPGFESWLRLDDGTVVEQQAEHRPETVG
ncbi:metallophosphoesterase family protein [Paenibacillus montanisoli]|uniref:Metallophosphoesterase n=1 Tax=Paenibacillus montanisoli TaxID=2081970 RepID=A0A328U1D6_9BACL|nr:metallophosphoesterase family protein [Paenibacillus montanisoli]RAP76608.1 metallophosphoesterase [Paenibacillus montanisoli]